MSSKFARQFEIPRGFPDVLKAFAREALRTQPEDIYAFGADYFERKANGLPDVQPLGVDAKRDEPSVEFDLEQLENVLSEMFRECDADNSGTIDAEEFKVLMEALSQRFRIPKDDMILFFSEADQDASGKIDWNEFLPLALQIASTMSAKKRVAADRRTATENAANFMVHGMNKEELTGLIDHLFRAFDQDNSGTLSRREINNILFHVDIDKDGHVSYKEFIPVAFDIILRMTELRLLNEDVEHESLAQMLNDLFISADLELTGMLPVDDVRDLLHRVRLGLSRLQICAVMSEAEVTSDGMIPYQPFIPRAAALIISLLDFEKSCLGAKESDHTGTEAAERFFRALDEALPDGEAAMGAKELLDRLKRMQENAGLADREVAALLNAAPRFQDGLCDVEELKALSWPLIRHMRLSQHLFRDGGGTAGGVDVRAN
uniref:EF-hand domain-containing protein n=1 Tax=Chromera velia CCMP2878 TaxID=1169474 RepID=A0A0G4G9I1_9ALVE|eukprot:Cvel_20867.t1-p1 / transcript=Cvel_20867.t1 / gene=Cvel_20867 / organism=Chromera_velia_CCMP2878 / gene_product=Caltractin, putative / transcript_product=Caltractin, putative / location=Cvel_scaffold1912:24505-29701(-) / protein_length=432 / sequence_SO=supercontig / SO=protein_coding / is_pseudo=false